MYEGGVHMNPKLLPNPVILSEVCNVEFASAFVTRRSVEHGTRVLKAHG